MGSGKAVIADLPAALLLASAARAAESVAEPVGRPDGGAAVQESYAIDGDDVLIRQSPQAGADRLLPPTVALAVKYGLKLTVEDRAGIPLDLTDLDKPTPHGPTVRVAGASDYVIRTPLARHVFEIPVSSPPDLMIGDNLLRFSTGTGGGGAGSGSALVMSRGMSYTIVYSWLYAFNLGE